MTSRSRALSILAVIAVAAPSAVLVAVGSGADPRAHPRGQRVDDPSHGPCPQRPPQILPSDALAGATRAALAQARPLYRGTNRKGMRATQAVLARLDDRGRGGYARVKCGRRVQNRTVVVHLEFPAMRPSASLSQGVVLVSRFAGGYRVWARLH